ncbi:hypothetical protein ABWW58_01380 [Sporolactobacillus sp. STCC-11]|uniref:hypothetical protein n=1 Tax=Sporolactobacillus caesalpiniae TaxID=3230362 RepID=UPI003394895C
MTEVTSVRTQEINRGNSKKILLSHGILCLTYYFVYPHYSLPERGGIFIDTFKKAVAAPSCRFRKDIE